VRFDNKVALVTGAALGIGHAIATSLASEGAAVVIADINAEVGEAAAQALRHAGARALAVACDVADRSQVVAAVAAACDHFGGVDILVNNAGLHLTGYVKPVGELGDADWHRLLDVNVLGVVNCACACRATMRERGGGVIVNISSIAGFKAENAYGISKQAVNGLTVAFARDFADDGIRVVGIAPGLVDSERAMASFDDDRKQHYVGKIQLIKRLGRMDDIANAARFLCSQDASFITGETLLVAGGAFVRP